MNCVESILGYVTQLPPFPAVLQRVLYLMDDPKASAQDVVEVIQYDQAITANVLMVCNSAYFGLRKPVSSIRDALVKIGFNRLVEIIVTRGSAYLFIQACQGYNLNPGGLWRHSVASALLSQIVCGHLQREKTPAQFTAALLHDVGKVILNHFVQEHCEEIKSLVREEDLSFPEAEKRVLGVDHAELGGKMAERWRFPAGIVSGIRSHHTPFLAREHHELVGLVHISDFISLLAGFGGGIKGPSPPSHQEVMKQYGLNERDLERMTGELRKELARVELALNIK